jgi:hypothetical protein
LYAVVLEVTSPADLNEYYALYRDSVLLCQRISFQSEEEQSCLPLKHRIKGWTNCIAALCNVVMILSCHYCRGRNSSDRPKLEDTTNPTTHGDWRLYVHN